MNESDAERIATVSAPERRRGRLVGQRIDERGDGHGSRGGLEMGEQSAPSTERKRRDRRGERLVGSEGAKRDGQRRVGIVADHRGSGFGGAVKGGFGKSVQSSVGRVAGASARLERDVRGASHRLTFSRGKCR
ncbi:hypothetical protein GCM10028856_00830 [Halopiger thermotolerans]